MFFAAVFEHLLERLAVVVRTRHRTVYICLDDNDAVSLRILPANPQLSFDGLLGLPLGTVPRVDDCHIFLWTQIWKGIAGMLFNFGMRAIKQQCKAR